MRRFHHPRVTARRRDWQRMQELLTLGHWPARLAHLLGGQGPVGVSRERFELTAPVAQRPLPVAFASDFHAGPCTHPRVLDSACRALAALEAPLLLLAGDFVCVSSRDIRELAPRLADIPAPLGKFAVLGNHDYWAGAARSPTRSKPPGYAYCSTRASGSRRRTTRCGSAGSTTRSPAIRTRTPRWTAPVASASS